MNKSIADDYFSMTKNPRDGTMSPLGSGTPGSNPLNLRLSWGDAQEQEGLSRVKSHTGEVTYKSNVVSRAQSDMKVYPYHTVHLTVPVPAKLRPLSPEDVLEKVTGRCITCSGVSNSKCTHLSTDNDSKGVVGGGGGSSTAEGSSIPLTSPGKPRKEYKPKSILSKKGAGSSSIDSRFSNSVSFDTVNLKFSDDLDNYPLSSFSDSDEDGYEGGNFSPVNRSGNSADEFDRGRSTMEIPGRRMSSRSPSRSLSPRARSPLPSQLDMVSQQEENMKGFFSLKYPTSPIITHDACTLTRTHELFDDMYAGRLKYVSPKLHNRVIMCYISGRRHTWVGIDWAANQLLEDGDTLVIVASIKNPSRSLARYQRRNSGVIVTSNITENKIRNSPEYAQAATENVMKYVLSIINPERIVKITVELAIGSTKDVFKDIFELYQPSLVIVGAKPGRAAPTRSWATKRISDRIVKTSPVPTIIVSPINMGLYETKFFKLLDKRMEFINQNKPNTYLVSHELLDEIDNAGVYSLEDQRDYIRRTASNDDYILKELNAILKEKKQNEGMKVKSDDEEDETESESSSSDLVGERGEARSESAYDDIDSTLDDSSVDSANPPAFVVNTNNSASFKLKRLDLEAQIVIYKEVSKLESEPLTKDSFKHLLTVVSDAAHKYGVQLAESAKMGGEESELVRTLTGAPEQLERRKSMVMEALDHDDFDEKLKRFRQQKKLEKQQKMAGGKTKPTIKAPKINIEMPNVSKSGSMLKTSRSPMSISSNGSASSIGSTISSPLNSTGKDDKKKKKRGGIFGFFGKKL